MSDFASKIRARAAARTFGAGDWSLAHTTRAAVGPSLELERILALPRRAPYTEGGDYDALVAKWTDKLCTPGGTQRLRAIQAFTFEDVTQCRGGFLSAGVGRGKTLIAALLGTVLNAERTLLFIPNGGRAQFFQISYPQLARDWQVPPLAVEGAAQTGPVLKVVTYDEWSQKANAGLLETYKPDLIIGDEAHLIFRKGTARYRRLKEFARHNPSTKFFFQTGTPTKNSIKDSAHLYALALRAGSPIPRNAYDLEEWSQALDPVRQPIAPGELVRFWGVRRDYSTTEVREGFRRRLVETRGVINTTVSVLPIRLELHTRLIEIPAPMAKALKDFRETWSTPGGEEITEILEFYRHAREMACGFYYKWADPVPTDDWLEARAEWFREVRGYLKSGGRPGMDSQGLLEDAARSGKRPSANYDAWAAIKQKCHPVSVPVWINDFLIRDALEWGRTHIGIIWYEHAAVGEMLHKLSAFSHYGAGDDGILFEDGTRTIIASRPTHFQSKELTAFHQQLILSPPSSGDTWEQLLGRTFRDRQTSGVIKTWVYQHTPELKQALKDAAGDAKATRENFGLDQLLLNAVIM